MSAPLTFPSAVHVGNPLLEWDSRCGPALWRVEAIVSQIVDVGAWLDGKGLMIVMVVGGDSGEVRDRAHFSVLKTHRRKTAYWAEVCVPLDLLEGVTNIDLAWMSIAVRALDEVASRLKLPPLVWVDWSSGQLEQ